MAKSTDVPDFLWRAMVGEIPEREYKFHPVRRFRFDFAYPQYMIAVEVEGGIWSRGRHTRGTGYISDMEKYNIAQEFGWIVLRYQPNMIDFEQVKRVMLSRIPPRF